MHTVFVIFSPSTSPGTFITLEGSPNYSITSQCYPEIVSSACGGGTILFFRRPGWCTSLHLSMDISILIWEIVQYIMIIPAYRNGFVEWRNDGMVDWRNGGMEEWRNGGMVDWWNCGMAELWMTEWRNGKKVGFHDGVYDSEYICTIIYDVMKQILINCVCGEAPIGLSLYYKWFKCVGVVVVVVVVGVYHKWGR